MPHFGVESDCNADARDTNLRPPIHLGVRLCSTGFRNRFLVDSLLNSIGTDNKADPTVQFFPHLKSRPHRTVLRSPSCHWQDIQMGQITGMSLQHQILKSFYLVRAFSLPDSAFLKPKNVKGRSGPTFLHGKHCPDAPRTAKGLNRNQNFRKEIRRRICMAYGPPGATFGGRAFCVIFEFRQGYLPPPAMT